MAKSTTAYKWDKDLNYSENLSFETKYYDFGTMGLDKTIYSIALSFGYGSWGQIGSGLILPTLNVSYRTNTIAEYVPYATFLSSSVSDAVNAINTVQTIKRKIKVKNIKGIQLKIYGMIPDDFLINDIAIEYRHIRKKAVGSPS
tara:strand:- start:571 stop:1002 length:432 start_codon:yes stop_codon:yes gene_type:complete